MVRKRGELDVYLVGDCSRPFAAPLKVSLQLRVETLAQAGLVIIARALAPDYVGCVGERVVFRPVEIYAKIILSDFLPRKA